MFNATLLKTACSAGATLLVGSLLAFNLFGDGSRPSAGLNRSDEVGFAMETLPEETPTIVAQIGGGQLAAKAVSAGEAANSSVSAAAVDPNVAAKPIEQSAGSNSAPASKEVPKVQPREPIQWKIADGEPPAWLTSSDLDQAEREMREMVRMKLRETVYVEFQDVPLRKAMEEVGKMIDVTIAMDYVELEAVGFDPDTPVRLSGEMSVREFLRRSLKSINAEAGLTYTVHESNIEITSFEGADRDPAIRFYDLSYILPNDSHLDSVVRAIETSVSPDSWVSSGGPNSICPVGSMLIVTCPEISHQKIELMLSRIAAMNKANLEKAAPQTTNLGNQAGGGMGGTLF